MLFNSKAESIVLQTFLEAIHGAATARKDEAEKRLAYFHDEQHAYIQAQLAQHFSEPDKLTPCFVNVVKKVVKNLATVYLDEPKRDVEGSERDKETFTKIASSCGLGPKMKTASRYAKLLKTILLRPVWRNGQMDLDILTPDVLDVVTGDTPEDLLSVMITHYPESGKADEVEYTVWTPESVKRLDFNGQVIDPQPNPYKELPFVPIWDYMPTSQFWLDGGADLVTIQDAINEKLTDLLHTIRFQGFGVGYTKGLSEDGGQIAVGAGSLINLPIDGDMGYAKTQAPIEEIIEAIDKLIKWAAVSNGLSASSISTDTQEESGIAKIVGNRELEELRRDDISLFRQYEKNLFRKFRIVWNVHNSGQKIGENAELLIDFAEIKPALSPDKQTEVWEKQLGMGVISQVDIVMEKNRDISTREEALELLKMLQQERFETADIKTLFTAAQIDLMPKEIVWQILDQRGILPEGYDPTEYKLLLEDQNRISRTFSGLSGSLTPQITAKE